MTMGLPATDTVNIVRSIAYTVSLTLITEQIVNEPEEQSNESTWQFQVSPALPPGYTLQIGGSFEMDVYKTGAPSLGSNAQQQISKNAVVLESDSITDTNTLMQNFSLNYINGDDIQFMGLAQVTDDDPGGPGGAFKEADASVSFTLDSAVFITGSGTILGLPDNVSISVTL